MVESGEISASAPSTTQVTVREVCSPVFRGAMLVLAVEFGAGALLLLGLVLSLSQHGPNVLCVPECLRTLTLSRR